MVSTTSDLVRILSELVNIRAGLVNIRCATAVSAEEEAALAAAIEAAQVPHLPIVYNFTENTGTFTSSVNVPAINWS